MRIILILSLLLAVRPPASAQCISRNVIWDQINNTPPYPEDALLAFFMQWKTTCESCKYLHDSIYAKVNHLVGRTYFRLGKLDSALIFTKKAIEINSLHLHRTSPASNVYSFYNLGLIERALNHVQASRNAFNQCIALARRYPEKQDHIPKAFKELAYLYYESGDYVESVRMADLGRHEAGFQSLPDLQATLFLIQAQAQLALKKEDAASRSIDSATALARSTGSPAVQGLIFTQLAGIRENEQNFPEAIEAYGKALEQYGSLLGKRNDKEHRFSYAVTLNNMGNIYLENLPDYPRALFYFRKAQQYMDVESVEARILGNIAQTYSRLHQYYPALQAYQQALWKLSPTFDPGQPGNNPGANRMRDASSKSHLYTLIREKADTWLDSLKLTSGKSVSNGRLISEALKTYMLADSMVDLMRWEHLNTESKLYWRNRTKKMYENAIETCFLARLPTRAFYFFEKSRAVLLNDRLNELGANRTLSPGDLAKERELNTQLSLIQEKLNNTPPGSAGFTSLSNRLLEIRNRKAEFIGELEKTNPAYFRYKYDNAVLSPEELRRQLLRPMGAKSAFVSFFTGEKALYSLCITPAHIQLRKTDLTAYREALEAFRRFLSDKSLQNREFGRFLGAANRLYTLLLAPFELASDSRVVVSPDEDFIPLEALSTSPTRPEYLVRLYAFSYTYAAGFLVKDLHPKARFPVTRNFLGMAPESFSASLKQSELSGSTEALQQIKTTFFLPRTYTFESATRKKFLEEAPRYRVVQLFTHATAETADNEPELYFADSALSLPDLTARHFSTQLMVLSACRTGVGKTRQGEGVFSLARGFASAGIPTTLTTLWSVENLPVYRQTALFYHFLGQGIPLDVALRKTRIAWLESAEAEDRLPYNWAGMVLIGQTQPLPTDHEVYYGLGAGLLIFCISCYLTFIRKRQKRVRSPSM